MPWCDILFLRLQRSSSHGHFPGVEGWPSGYKNIADAYQGKETPSDLMRVVDNPVRCPKTNKLFQPNMRQIFLMPAD
jgi:hypothetical protein